MINHGITYFRYSELPRVQRPSVIPCPEDPSSRKGTIGQYFTSMHCPICENLTNDGICKECRKSPHQVALTLSSRIHQAERKYVNICQVRYTCTYVLYECTCMCM